MKKLEWVRVNGKVGEQKTTNELYYIWHGAWTRYNVYLLVNSHKLGKDYIRIGGANTITECKKIAQKHFNSQNNVTLINY